MAAISMVLENRRRATIDLARQRSDKLNEYKRSFGLRRNSSDRDVYLNIERKIKNGVGVKKEILKGAQEDCTVKHKSGKCEEQLQVKEQVLIN